MAPRRIDSRDPCAESELKLTSVNAAEVVFEMLNMLTVVTSTGVVVSSRGVEMFNEWRLEARNRRDL